MGIFSGILGGLFSKQGRRKKKRRRGAKRSGSGFRPSDGGAEGSVLVSSLFGSGGKEISDYIANMLSTEGSFQTLRLEKTLKLNLRVGLLERLLLASDEGSNWIRDEQADLMIWGEMEDMGTVAGFVFYLLAQVRMVSPELLGWQTRWICRFQFLTVLAILFAPRPWRHCFPLHLDRRKSSRTV
jgi:hypothetical protein